MILHIARLVFLCCLFAPVKLQAQAGAFNLEDWPGTQASLKPLYVKAIMEQASVHKVSFTLAADFYSAELDRLATFATNNNYRPYLTTSVAQNLATIAVIHCDWHNGVPPLEFAQKYLGARQIEQLQPIYAKAIAKLQNNCVD